MKKYFVCVLAIVCVLALCACGTDTTKPDDSETPDVQEELPQEETAEATPYADILHDIELAALRAVNSDVLGWILIPDAPISYPLVQKVTMLII